MDRTAQISIAQEDGGITISGGGTLDLSNCQEFSDGLKQASRNAENVTVDLRHAEFIDTQVVQDLARAAVTMLERGKRLKVLASTERYPLRVIHISGFEGIMDVFVDQ